MIAPSWSRSLAAASRGAPSVSPPAPRRALLLVVAALALAGGFALTGADAASQAASLAGPELTRLLRAMAGLKAVMALAALAAVLWRLGSPVTTGRFAAYALACAAMASGPALIWRMAHVGAGALLLHGGLLACLLLLWRDPAVAARLGALVAARRQRAGVTPGRA